MKKFNVIMNGTPLSEYEMDEIFGGDTNVNCQNKVQGCCISNHNTNCGTTNSIYTCKYLNQHITCYELNACNTPANTKQCWGEVIGVE